MGRAIMSAMLKLKYLNQDEFGIEVASFLPYVKKLSKIIEMKEGVLNVVFVNDPYIQALNKAYRNMDKPTDVLSFTYDQDELVGEIYVSFETAERQAQEHEHSLPDELIKLIVHGILHVHHFDHEEERDYQKMFAIEKSVLGKIAGEKV